MKAHVVRPHELDAGHIERWRRIQDGDEIYRSPFYSLHFTLAVGQARDDAYVAILEQDNDIVGYFPFHRLHAGVAKPIGGPISDYHGPILATEARNSDPNELLEACGLSAYDFNHLPTTLRTLSKTAYDHTKSRHIDLSDGFDAYAAERSSAWTKVVREMRRRSRKAEREIGPVTFEFHTDSDADYNAHVDLKNRLFQRLKVKSVLDIPWVDRTLDIIRRTQHPDFAGVMTTVKAGDRLMGAHFGVRSRNVWHWWFPSYDLELHKYGPGIIMIHQAARCANEHGLKLIDFGRGDSDYKISFANGATDLCEGSIERPATRPGVVRKVQKSLVGLTNPIPLGKYDSYPRRILGRFVSSMRLPHA